MAPPSKSLHRRKTRQIVHQTETNKLVDSPISTWEVKAQSTNGPLAKSQVTSHNSKSNSNSRWSHRRYHRQTRSNQWATTGSHLTQRHQVQVYKHQSIRLEVTPCKMLTLSLCIHHMNRLELHMLMEHKLALSRLTKPYRCMLMTQGYWYRVDSLSTSTGL